MIILIYKSVAFVVQITKLSKISKERQNGNRKKQRMLKMERNLKGPKHTSKLSEEEL